MELFIGLDVSLTSTAACDVSGQGKIVKEAQIRSDPASLIGFCTSCPRAGPLPQWLYKGLTEAGFETVLMETRQVKGALKAVPIKSDRRDAEGIARLLQMGWFQPVYCKSVSSQETRALLSTRKAIQHSVTNLKLSLRGVLRNIGLKMGRVTSPSASSPSCPLRKPRGLVATTIRSRFDGKIMAPRKGREQSQQSDPETSLNPVER